MLAKTETDQLPSSLPRYELLLRFGFGDWAAANVAKASARGLREQPRPRSGKELSARLQGRRCPRRKASLCHCSACIRSCAAPLAAAFESLKLVSRDYPLHVVTTARRHIAREDIARRTACLNFRASARQPGKSTIRRASPDRPLAERRTAKSERPEEWSTSGPKQPTHTQSATRDRYPNITYSLLESQDKPQMMLPLSWVRFRSDWGYNLTFDGLLLSKPV
jgi:hypothetical protein